MPAEQRARFVRDHGLSEYDARVLVSDRALASFYEEAARAAGGDHKQVANWVTQELLRRMKESDAPLSRSKVTPAHIAELVGLVRSGEISVTAAKEQVFTEVWASGTSPREVVAQKGLAQVSDAAEIAKAVDAVLAESEQAVAQYRAGKTQVLGALVGKVMKRMGGKANPAVVNKVLAERIAAL